MDDCSFNKSVVVLLIVVCGCVSWIGTVKFRAAAALYVSMCLCVYISTYLSIYLSIYQHSWSSFLSSTWERSTFSLKEPYVRLTSIDDISKLSSAWDLANVCHTIQLVYNFSLGSIWSHQCSAYEFLLNSFKYLSVYLSNEEIKIDLSTNLGQLRPNISSNAAIWVPFGFPYVRLLWHITILLFDINI